MNLDSIDNNSLGVRRERLQIGLCAFGHDDVKRERQAFSYYILSRGNESPSIPAWEPLLFKTRSSRHPPAA